MSEAVRMSGAEQIPYFRTAEFSELMLENERLMCKFANAPEGSRAVFITGSGTASMEASIMNVFDKSDRVIVVNGGSFGHRFAELCEIHEIPHTEIKLGFGEPLTAEKLAEFDGKDHTAFVVNIHETSTGMHYDLDLISDFCQRNGLFLLVDAISSFIADPIDMSGSGIDLMITGSQKALACPPGVSVIVMNKKTVDLIAGKKIKCMYLNLRDALKNGERGQTPFTPAVGTLIQINIRLREIESSGGIGAETSKIAALAKDFRERIAGLPFEIASPALSNAVTPLHPLNASAYDIFLHLKDEYNIWVCPNGGELADKIFRVGHIGALTAEDNQTLINAFCDMRERGLL